MKISISEIKIGERFRKDLGDTANLERSIKQHGQLVPIGIIKNHELVHGFRRLMSMKKLGISKIEAVVLPENIHKKWAEADENTTHKHFTVAEIATIDESLRQEFEDDARLRQQKGRKLDLSETFAKGKSAKKIAAIVGITDRHLEKIRTIKGAAEEYPQLAGMWKKVGANRMKVDKGYNEVKQFQKIQRDEQLALKNPNPVLNGSNFKLERGPMEELGKKFPDNSIDMIFTDPPYEAKYLYLYVELALLAYRVLKAGGSLAMIVPNGGNEFAYVFDKVREAGMLFHHYISLMHGGNRERLHKSGIWVDHKPILLFTKPGGNNDLPIKYFDIHNVVWSNPPSKDTHEWEQGIEETEYMIKPLTVTGQTILDPFVGSGTTGEAALKLGRKFIGIEIDKVAYSNASRRLTSFASRLKIQPISKPETKAKPKSKKQAYIDIEKRKLDIGAKLRAHQLKRLQATP